MNFYQQFRSLTMQYRLLFVWGIHLLMVTAAFALAVILVGHTQPLSSPAGLFTFLLFIIAIKLILFHCFSLFKGSWRYVEIHDLVKIFKATSWAALVLMIAAYMFSSVGYQVVAIDWVISLVFIAGTRLALKRLDQAFKGQNVRVIRRALIVGAGDAGEMICREMLNNPTLGYLPTCFTDDQTKKHTLQIHGVPILGTSSEITKIVRQHEIDEIVIAIPSASPHAFERIFIICKSTGIPFKTVPTTRAILEGRTAVEQLREVRLEDLLDRQQVRVDEYLIRLKLEGKRILITGAGGSIGSELARQISVCEPESLILYDQAETALNDIDLELSKRLPYGRLITVLGDILDSPKLDQVMAQYRPQWLFHAAAYKHVPMMERYPIEAVRVNVLGTHSVAEAAARHGVQRLIYISTDKAVHPSSVMGMTKRVGELIALNMFDNALSSVAVRFGNVLGSNGSVVPLFQRQIAEGGPVTVTHPDVSRFFMTIPEAVELVLTAGIMGSSGETFILDMGQPVKIVDLARKLITLAGLEPDKDVKIIFTGLRPGEKLHEELLIEGEDLQPTFHPKVKLINSNHYKKEMVSRFLTDLEQQMTAKTQDGLVLWLEEIITEIDKQHNRQSVGSEKRYVRN